MRRLRWLGIVLVAALIATFGRTGAHAVARAATTFPSLTMNYSDGQGPGTLVLTAVADDPTSGGTTLAVTLSQGGVNLAGAGEAWAISQNTPRHFGIAFWVEDGQGHDYFFNGELTMGVDTFSGGGAWTSIQNPSATDSWTAFRMFP